MSDNGTRKMELPVERARGGETTGRVRIILAVSTIAAAICLVIVMWVFSAVT